MNAPLILCSTHRLARSLRQTHAREAWGAGRQQWVPLAAMPLGDWLDTVVGNALLAGEIEAEAAPAFVPDVAMERMLWERAIASSLKNDVAALFDLGGMAATAMEAHRLLEIWRVKVPYGEHSEETRQFFRWREEFLATCKRLAWMDPARRMAWQVDCLENGAGVLPLQVALAGFDRLSPQEARLCAVLQARGVEIQPMPLGLAQPGHAVKTILTDQEAECRAAVAWVRQRLSAHPQARIAIVSPDLAAVRSRLAALLDDALSPLSLVSATSSSAPQYDFSLGLPLGRQPVVATALALLRVFCQRRSIEQSDLSALLLQPYWSAGMAEADGRAQLDAAMRAELPAFLSLDRLARYLRKHVERGGRVAMLAEHFQAGLQLWSAQPERQLPSAWAVVFDGLLHAVGWPGDRAISSHEFQARQAFQEALAGLSRLDALLGPIDRASMVYRLGQACTEQIFQPRAEGDPAIMIMGMMEAVSAPVDAMWVMGMNDHLWPPPARPNPLLPVAAQRAERAPNADASIQAEFAQVIHERLMHSASELVFSAAHVDGDRELRPSPLIVDLPEQASPPGFQTLAEQFVNACCVPLEQLADHQAPAVAAGERVSGGAGVLKAQAICPAWAYYQYRLGAHKLETPVEGLDAAGRGSLLHAALEAFWRGRSSAILDEMTEQTLAEAIAQAIAQGMARFNAEREEPLPAGFMRLESGRLQRLLQQWLDYEKTRPIGFTVRDCEHEVTLEIEGISVRLIMDRVDLLDDGRLIILDYKTGANLDVKNWAQDRLTEPQLPIYASLALAGERIAGVAFARVRMDDARFSGVAEEDDLLPGVSGLSSDKVRKEFTAERFPVWADVLEHWQTAIRTIAGEIRSGEAAVRFTDEADLIYCEVKPLLRLPERQLLFEAASSAEEDALS